MNDEPGRAWLERAERYADGSKHPGLIHPRELAALGPVGGPRADQEADLSASFTLGSNIIEAAKWAALSAWGAIATEAKGSGHDASLAALAERTNQASLLRDIFGKPFHNRTIDRAWLTPGVVALAESVYQDRVFDRMQVLGEALEEAGCADVDVLCHCRSGIEHVRGCWVVDSILGKT